MYPIFEVCIQKGVRGRGEGGKGRRNKRVPFWFWCILVRGGPPGEGGRRGCLAASWAALPAWPACMACLHAVRRGSQVAGRKGNTVTTLKSSYKTFNLQAQSGPDPLRGRGDRFLHL